jgi:cyclopropane-fatty-acyl-phospholipid synthase
VDRRLSLLETDELRVVEDGETRTYGTAPNPDSLRATLQVHDARFWGEVARRGPLGAAEGFLEGHWSADDLVALIRIFARNRVVYDGIDTRWTRAGAAGARVLHWLRSNTRRGSQRNISAHYDLGNDFFALMLDPTWTYSCGIFETPEATLEQAQRAKYDRACRKLELGPDDHVLEIGTGWGGFAEYAAQNYGSRVTTTTVSKEQYAFAEERIARAGLSDRVKVIFEDYRDLEGEYDKLVSIEMIEAVGDKHLDSYFRVCSERLRPEGLAVIQAILVQDRDYAKSVRTVDFVKRYVFPGGQLPSLGAIHGALARATDMHMLQLEDISTHYVRTLAAWRERFFKNLEGVRALGLPDRFIRLWEFYLCYCEGSFAERATGVAQILLEKPRGRREPLLASLG